MNGPNAPGTMLKVGRFTEKPSVPAGGAVAPGGQDSGAASDAVPPGPGAGGGGPQTAALPLDASFNPFATHAGTGTSSAAGATASATSNGTNGAATNGTTRGMAHAGGGGAMTSGKVAFKSKVVSRGHAEIWCEAGGQVRVEGLGRTASAGSDSNEERSSSSRTQSRPRAPSSITSACRTRTRSRDHMRSR